MKYLLFYIFLILFLIWLFSFKEPTKKQQHKTNPLGKKSDKQNNKNHNQHQNFSESGTTIWAGPPISMKFAYRSKGKTSQKRTVLVDRCFRANGHHYLEGHCCLKKERRYFRLDRMSQDIWLEPQEGIIDKAKLIQLFISGRYISISSLPVRQCTQQANLVSPISSSPSKLPSSSSSSSKSPRSWQSNIAKQKRAKALSEIRKIDWEKKGLLSISGYRVGKSHGVDQASRHEILLDILINDDLTDIDNRTYAFRWGPPGSHKRYKKLTNTLKSFINNAKGRQRSSNINLKQAIKEWRSDLAFVNKSYKQR